MRSVAARVTIPTVTWGRTRNPPAPLQKTNQDPQAGQQSRGATMSDIIAKAAADAGGCPGIGSRTTHHARSTGPTQFDSVEIKRGWGTAANGSKPSSGWS